MPKILNLHLDNWSLAIEMANEQEREERIMQLEELDISAFEELLERAQLTVEAL